MYMRMYVYVYIYIHMQAFLGQRFSGSEMYTHIQRFSAVQRFNRFSGSAVQAVQRFSRF